MKRSKKLIYGCVVASVTLLLCIPAMAGGYSAKSELKINIIGLHPCSGEQELMEEMFLLEQEKEPELSEDELPKATPSNATKSNASSTKKYLPNKNLQGKKKIQQVYPMQKCLMRNGLRKRRLRRFIRQVLPTQDYRDFDVHALPEKVFKHKFPDVHYCSHIQAGG